MERLKSVKTNYLLTEYEKNSNVTIFSSIFTIY